MKKLTYIIMALALVLGLAQCKKEQPKPQGEMVYITLKVGSDAKHTVNPANGKVDYTTGDKIYVGNHGKYIGTLTYDGSAFGGEITDPQTSDYLHFYFVGGLTPSAAPVAGTTTSFTVDISNQSSTLPVLSYVHTAEKYAGGTSYTCMLENKCALVELTLTSGTTAAVGIGDRYTEATVNFGGTLGIAPNTSTTGMITMKSGSETKKYAIMLPQAATVGAHIAIGPEGYTLDIPAIENNGFAKLSNSSAVASNIVYLNYLTENYTATNGQTLTGTLGANVKVSIAAGATVTLDNASINAAGTWTTGNYAGITCLGNATIILSGTNTVKGFFDEYPGVYVPESYTLTIQGTGSLTASSNGFGAGIGGGYDLSCGNIEIQGGTITATGGDGCAGIGAGNAVYNVASCGNITISGGNITANGGESGAGIGTGFNGTCLNITINNTVTSVTATKGSNAPNSIGAGEGGTCGTVTIGGVTGAISTSPYTYPAPVAPSGVLGGKFTVNAGGGQVSFSQGNLQYQASTQTWRFAPNQYDMIGSDNANISDSYTGWIDLLGWGTGNNPTNSSTNNDDYSTCTDWGVNAISNGGNTADLWRTLSKDEWVYFFANHTKGWSNVNGVNGYVIRPDGISTAVAASYTSSEWAVEESAGSVFLPAACSRGGTTFNPGAWGDYWSSTPYNSIDAYYLYFHQGGQNPSSNSGRFGGRSVRLVYETPFQGAGTESDPYLISSEADWIILANKVNSGNSFTGKFFRQTANIDVTTMVGNSSDSKPFSGTYDGDGKTLNLSLNTSTPHTAPFRFIENATIKNVVTTGSVHSTDNHPSGLVGETDGTCTIQNCRVGASVGGAQHSGGIVGHCWHANISIIGCVYSGTLTPASGQWTGGIIGWGGDGGGHTISISDCLFAGTLTGSTKFHPIGILQNQSNTKYLSNTYYTLGAQNTNDDASFVNGLSYKGKFARSIVGGTGVTVARTGATAVYDVSGITSYGTGILYDGVLYAGNGEEVSLSLSPGETPTGSTFRQYTVTGGGSLDNPTSNSPTLTMTDANQTIGAEWE